MLGAIIGDIVGSRFEWHNYKGKDFELFHPACKYTDDSVLTIAIAKAFLDSKKDYSNLSELVIKYMREYANEYPNAGYGGKFLMWMISENPKPYNSYGNGAAMRVSSVGFVSKSIEECKELSRKVTEVTHNHPEGLKGAEAIAVAILLARQGKSKEEIKAYMEENYYAVDSTVDEIRKVYDFDVSTQGSVPPALQCFYESTDFEDCIRNAISIGGDSDTIGAIVGGLAEAYYGVPEKIKKKALEYLSDDLLNILIEFETRYNKNKIKDRKSIKKMGKNTSNNEREEIHKTIWSIADDLRGAVDGWVFKSYVLGTMFYRYLSENIRDYINENERKAGDIGFDYAKLNDKEAIKQKEEIVKQKGFFILPSELFCNLYKEIHNHKEDLNIVLEKILKNIENSAKGTESEKDFSGLFADFDMNSINLGATVLKRNERLIKVIEGINGLDIGEFKENNVDAFGDAYEYLMSMYASNAGKSGGEFFTPQEVSELLTRLATVDKKTVNKVYDPACGSGSLLLKSAKILGKENVRNGFFGQEINPTTYNLCRINMFLHDIGYDKFDIACEDTLLSPQHWDDEPFEVIVSNPPYGLKWKGDDDALLINDERYAPAGVLAPKSNADYAFIMHSLKWLAPNGAAAIVCFPGIFYRGGAEQKIRKYLINNNFIDAIIELPSNLFFGTGITTDILVLKKNKKDNKVLFIKAADEYKKATNKNVLTEKNIDKIIEYYKKRKSIEYITNLVSSAEIEKENYDLSVATYVKTPPPPQEDIKKINKKIDEIVAKEEKLREEINRIISEIEEN